MPKYQATAYIRLSYTDDRSSESDSVTNQRKLIENFIERNPDIQIVSEKIDDGYSGIIFDRPAFKEMMQDITDGQINCVIVKVISRLPSSRISKSRSRWVASRLVLKPRLVTHLLSPFQFLCLNFTYQVFRALSL